MADLLKSYLKYRYKDILLVVAILILMSSWLINSDRGSIVAEIIFFLIASSREAYHFDAKLEKIKRLKAKGLTEEDLLDIEFVEKWEVTRAEGLRKYCIRDGGIIAGAGLALGISLVFFMIYHGNFTSLLAEPGDMFSFIVCSYMAGAISGVVLYRILWHYNEQRFLRLTDPSNFLFAAKNASFNNQA